MKHTALPWKVHSYEQNKGGYFQISNGAEWIAAPNTRANAEYIVRACNSHDELVEALEEFIFLEKTNMTKKQVQLRIDRAKYALAKATKNHEHDPITCGCEYKGNNMWSCGHIDQQ